MSREPGSLTEAFSQAPTPLKVGDRVRVVPRDHPWFGAIGVIIAPSEISSLVWIVELETILPGQRANVVAMELRRV